MKRPAILIVIAALTGMGAASCPTPTPPTPPVPPSTYVATVHVFSGDPSQDQKIPGAAVRWDDSLDPGTKVGVTDEAGNFSMPARTARGFNVCATAAGFDDVCVPANLTSDLSLDISLTRQHVDPSTIPLEQLARIRGAMWPRASVCADPPLLPYGPRPFKADNIIGTPYFDAYSQEQQQAVIRCLRSVGYTHVVVGGLVDTWAYHGQYIGHDYSTPEAFERFLDILQTFWDGGLTPVVFVRADNWTYEQTEAAVTPLFSQPRAQRLIRIVIMPGWEPTKYDWSSVTWAKYVALGKRLLPNAVQGIHTVSDVDAPVGTDALYDDNGKSNGDGWRRVIEAGASIWFIQNGPYETGPDQAPQAAEFAAQFQAAGDGAKYHSAAWHFAGNAGWPKASICLVAAEHTAFSAYWQNRPTEAERQAWGDLAVRSGSCGYLDGGTVDVPVRR